MTPLPDLGSGPVVLRLVHAVNPNLPRLSDDELERLRHHARTVSKEHFGIDIRFSMSPDTTVAALLAAIPDHVVGERREVIFDFKNGTGNRQRLVTAYHKALKRDRVNAEKILAYVKPYLTTQNVKARRRSIAKALATTHLDRLTHWRDLKTPAGQHVIDDSDANEYIVWDLLGYSGMSYDVIITNQLVASAEYDDAAINAALRGGVSAGGTGYHKTGRYKTFSFLSTFPFTERSSLPPGTADAYEREQAVRLAGQYLAHELGHLLLLLAHPYGNSACVMRPEPMFNYAWWARRLDAERCPLGSSRGNTPGTAKIFYRTDW